MKRNGQAWRWLGLGLALSLLAGVAGATGIAKVEMASVSPAGKPGNSYSGSPAISVDGRYVAFESMAENLVPGDTNDRLDVFVRDRMSGGIERVSVSSTGAQSQGPPPFVFLPGTTRPSISADGRYVAFS